ncbi:hypothetical protein ABMA28_013119 [Loxostege sticticalis]|uniref:Vitellogenin domain-containing protein n=1 Tax=Loxostege sticticalis TaxID=481309 RepID=A0ABD0S5U4_LOXSC
MRAANFIILIALSTPVFSTKDVRLLFPLDKQYIYEVHASLSTLSTSADGYKDTSWSLTGRLKAQVFGNDSQVRFELDDIKIHVTSKGDGHISYPFDEELKPLKFPWIVEYYKDICLIESIYLPSEPTWVSNMKRALSLNFQLKKGDGIYTSYEPCIHDYRCLTTYVTEKSKIKKFTSSPSSPKFGNSWRSVPWTDPVYRQDQALWNSIPDTTSVSTERDYSLNDKNGLTDIYMSEFIIYKLDETELRIVTEMTIQYETELQAAKPEWPKLTRSSVKYDRETCKDSLCGIMSVGQGLLKNRTFEILLKIAKKGIDADNIVRNSSMIHSLDFINLLSTMSQLNYTTLKRLFEDLVLGTSYELETSRNIFLEMLPYSGSDSAVRFVKYLVIEEKEKIEDSALIALIRKLPFTGANYTQELLQELEAFTKLGLDFPQEIRHSAILSFATLLHQTKRDGKVGDDYFDNMVVKYVRMYSDCPHYMDRLIWLQGLCNIGFWAQKYTMEIFTDNTKKRNERLWAAFSTNYIDNQYYTDGQVRIVDLLLPILTNTTEDPQIKMAAVHVFLTSTAITQNDFLIIQRYLARDETLYRFWYMAIKSLEINKNFDGYKLASMYVPAVSGLKYYLNTNFWAINNLIISSSDQTSTLHLLSTGDPGELPNFAGLRLSVDGKRVSVYISAEGVASNLYKRMHNFNEQDLKMDKLVELLKDFKAWASKSSEEVHIDFVVKIQEKAVFVSHMNQTRFDSWNLLELAKSVNEFLRLGSHINQQLVYCPTHKELIFPNELGIPVRLQTTTLSFTSIRGNLTTPSTDLHIRYQGVSLTSLSSFGALVQSEHTMRVQTSTVAHLPIKFNVTAAPTGVVNFISPNLQRGGIVMHTRVQVEKRANGSVDAFTLKHDGHDYEVNESSIYFDCDHSAAGLGFEDLFTTSFYDFLNSLRSSRLILNSFPILVSSPSKSCGIIYPPKTLGEDKGLLATLVVDDAPSVAGFLSGKQEQLKLSLLLKYYEQDIEVPEDDTIFQLDAEFKISNLDDKVITRLIANGSGPKTPSSNWQLSIENYDYNIYAKNMPPGTSYVGAFGIHFATETNRRSLKVQYSDNKYAMGKLLNLKISNRNLPQDMLANLGLGCEAETFREKPLFSTSEDLAEFNVTLEVKNAIASLAVNNDAKIQFVSLGFDRLFEAWTNLKMMNNYYKEFPLSPATEKDFETWFKFGSRGETLECTERLLLGDCTEKPRFAITQLKSGGLRAYAGGYFVTVERGDDRIITNETQSENYLKITRIQNGVKITSPHTGVQIYYRNQDTLILVPSSHLHAICGQSVTSNTAEFKKCNDNK